MTLQGPDRHPKRTSSHDPVGYATKYELKKSLGHSRPDSNVGRPPSPAGATTKTPPPSGGAYRHLPSHDGHLDGDSSLIKMGGCTVSSGPEGGRRRPGPARDARIRGRSDVKLARTRSTSRTAPAATTLPGTQVSWNQEARWLCTLRSGPLRALGGKRSAQHIFGLPPTGPAAARELVPPPFRPRRTLQSVVRPY